MSAAYPDPAPAAAAAAAAAASASAAAATAERPVRIEDAWEFYRSLGSPKHVMAPMVDQSEQPFRLLARRHGVQLCYTPMFHARLFATNPGYRKKNWTSQRAAAAEDRPLIVQFCANDPDELLAAARCVEKECEAVDINFGCPQGIARKGHYGSFLLSNVPLMVSLVRVLHQNLSIPVTAKVRILPTLEETLRMAKAMEDAGAAILTVHGRTKEQNKHLVGANDFETIRRIKEHLSIPVFANGGIETAEDARRALEVTGCDGVMSSEGLLCNPALFEGRRLPCLEMAREYLALAREYPPARSCIRPHMFKLLHRMLSVHTHVRGLLGRAKESEMEAVFEELERADAALGDGREAAYEGKVHWYRRHQTFKPQLAPKDPAKRKLFEKAEAQRAELAQSRREADEAAAAKRRKVDGEAARAAPAAAPAGAQA